VAEVINLNRARKAKAKVAGKAVAVENRVKHGRTKAEKAAGKLEADRARKELEGKKRED
jgi:hypothetical protein